MANSFLYTVHKFYKENMAAESIILAVLKRETVSIQRIFPPSSMVSTEAARFG